MSAHFREHHPMKEEIILGILVGMSLSFIIVAYARAITGISP